MKKMESDVIVIAAGLSGLAAAISASENGAKVIAFEKMPIAGGAANMAMGPLGIGSRFQRQHMITITPGEAFRRHMFFCHYKVDGRLVRDFYYKSGETIDWLEDMGVVWHSVQKAFDAPETTKAYSNGELTWHCVMPEGGGHPGPRAASAMMKKMTEKALELGVDLQLGAPVKKIIIENGRAAGVIATDRDGNEVEGRAKAIIIATGGYGANPKMIKDETGFEYGKTIFNFAIPGMDGDGLRMAWEAGAGKTQSNMELMYQLPDNMNHFIVEGAFRQPCLWVNRLGYRFMPEDQISNTTFTGNAISVQPAMVAYSIFDSKILKKYKKHGPDILSHVHPGDLFDYFDEQWDRDIANGYEPVCEANTIEELAEKAGIDVQGLAETIQEYNEMCEMGYDGLFDKDRRFMEPIQKEKFYCCRQNVGGYGSLGGILINYKTEVMTKDYNVIPGLYAAGNDACNIYGDSYPFILAGNTMGFCLNSGRIAGENAAKFSGNV